MISTENYAWPLALPNPPIGITKTMVMHLNMGHGKGAASYELRNAEGGLLPALYGYSDGGKKTYFAFVGEEADYPTWAALVEAWPEYRRRQMGLAG